MRVIPILALAALSASAVASESLRVPLTNRFAAAVDVYYLPDGVDASEPANEPPLMTLKSGETSGLSTFLKHAFLLRTAGAAKDVTFEVLHDGHAFEITPDFTLVDVSAQEAAKFDADNTCDDDASASAVEKTRALLKQPTFSQAQAVKFRNLSNKRIFQFYIPEGNAFAPERWAYQTLLEPNAESTTNSYDGHVFLFATDPENPAGTEVYRVAVELGRVIYAYLEEGTADPEALKMHYEELAFDEKEYQPASPQNRPWIAYYPPRGKPKSFMYPTEYIGQTFDVQTEWGHTNATALESANVVARRQTFTLEVLSVVPKVLLIKNLFTTQEAEHIVNLGKSKVVRSTVAGRDPASSNHGMASDTRTSKNTWISRPTNAFTEIVYKRAADVLRVDPERMHHAYPNGMAENMQLVSYENNQAYAPHHDWGVQNSPHTRFSTLLFYLTDQADPEAGGETCFPKARVGNPREGLCVHPGRGNAVLFYSQLEDGNVDDFSLHEARPVVRGKKWLSNFWTHDYVFWNEKKIKNGKEV